MDFRVAFRISVPSGNGRSASPSGEATILDVPGGDESHRPTEVGGFRMQRARVGRIPFDTPAESPGVKPGVVQLVIQAKDLSDPNG